MSNLSARLLRSSHTKPAQYGRQQIEEVDDGSHTIGTEGVSLFTIPSDSDDSYENIEQQHYDQSSIIGNHDNRHRSCDFEVKSDADKDRILQQLLDDGAIDDAASDEEYVKYEDTEEVIDQLGEYDELSYGQQHLFDQQQYGSQDSFNNHLEPPHYQELPEQLDVNSTKGDDIGSSGLQYVQSPTGEDNIEYVDVGEEIPVDGPLMQLSQKEIQQQHHMSYKYYNETPQSELAGNDVYEEFTQVDDNYSVISDDNGIGAETVQHIPQTFTPYATTMQPRHQEDQYGSDLENIPVQQQTPVNKTPSKGSDIFDAAFSRMEAGEQSSENFIKLGSTPNRHSKNFSVSENTKDILRRKIRGEVLFVFNELIRVKSRTKKIKKNEVLAAEQFDVFLERMNILPMSFMQKPHQDLRRESFILAESLSNESLNSSKRDLFSCPPELLNGVSVEGAVAFMEIINGFEYFEDPRLSKIVDTLKTYQLTNQKSKQKKVRNPVPPKVGTRAAAQKESRNQRHAVINNTFAREQYRQNRWEKVLDEVERVELETNTFRPVIGPPPMPRIGDRIHVQCIEQSLETDEFMTQEVEDEKISYAPGHVVQCNRDGTFHVRFDATDYEERHVPLSSIHMNYHADNDHAFRSDIAAEAPLYERLQAKTMPNSVYRRQESRSSEQRELDRHCSFQPKITGESPFISDRSLRNLTASIGGGELNNSAFSAGGDTAVAERLPPRSPMLSRSAVNRKHYDMPHNIIPTMETLPHDRPYDERSPAASHHIPIPTPKPLVGGMYTCGFGFVNGSVVPIGVPLFYFDPYHTPNFQQGTYDLVVTQVQTTTATAPPPSGDAGTIEYEEIEVSDDEADGGNIPKPPPLPTGGSVAAVSKKAAPAASNKIVINKREEAPKAKAGISWVDILAEMQAKMKAKAEGGGAAPKPVEKAKPVVGKLKKGKNKKRRKSDFKDVIDELAYTLAKMRGDIVEEDESSDEEEEASPTPKKKAAPVGPAALSPAVPVPLESDLPKPPPLDKSVLAHLPDAPPPIAAAPAVPVVEVAPEPAPAPAVAPAPEPLIMTDAVAPVAAKPAPPPLPEAWPAAVPWIQTPEQLLALSNSKKKSGKKKKIKVPVTKPATGGTSVASSSTVQTTSSSFLPTGYYMPAPQAGLVRPSQILLAGITTVEHVGKGMDGLLRRPHSSDSDGQDGDANGTANVPESQGDEPSVAPSGNEYDPSLQPHDVDTQARTCTPAAPERGQDIPEKMQLSDIATYSSTPNSHQYQEYSGYDMSQLQAENSYEHQPHYHDDYRDNAPLEVSRDILHNKICSSDLPLPAGFHGSIQRISYARDYRKQMDQSKQSMEWRQFDDHEKLAAMSLDNTIPVSFYSHVEKRNETKAMTTGTYRHLQASTADADLPLTHHLPKLPDVMHVATTNGDLPSAHWATGLRQHKGRDSTVSRGQKGVPAVNLPSSGVTRGGMPQCYPRTAQVQPKAPTFHHPYRLDRRHSLAAEREKQQQLRKEHEQEVLRHHKETLRKQAKVVATLVAGDGNSVRQPAQPNESPVPRQKIYSYDNIIKNSLRNTDVYIDINSVQKVADDYNKKHPNKSAVSKQKEILVTSSVVPENNTNVVFSRSGSGQVPKLRDRSTPTDTPMYHAHDVSFRNSELDAFAVAQYSNDTPAAVGGAGFAQQQSPMYAQQQQNALGPMYSPVQRHPDNRYSPQSQGYPQHPPLQQQHHFPGTAKQQYPKAKRRASFK